MRAVVGSGCLRGSGPLRPLLVRSAHAPASTSSVGVAASSSCALRVAPGWGTKVGGWCLQPASTTLLPPATVHAATFHASASANDTPSVQVARARPDPKYIPAWADEVPTAIGDAHTTFVEGQKPPPPFRPRLVRYAEKEYYRRWLMRNKRYLEPDPSRVNPEDIVTDRVDTDKFTAVYSFCDGDEHADLVDKKPRYHFPMVIESVVKQPDYLESYQSVLRARVVKLHMLIPDMGLTKSKESILRELVGNRVKKNWLKIRCDKYATREENEQYSIRLMGEMLLEVDLLDQTRPWDIVQDEWASRQEKLARLKAADRADRAQHKEKLKKKSAYRALARASSPFIGGPDGEEPKHKAIREKMERRRDADYKWDFGLFDPRRDFKPGSQDWWDKRLPLEDDEAWRQAREHKHNPMATVLYKVATNPALKDLIANNKVSPTVEKLAKMEESIAHIEDPEERLKALQEMPHPHAPKVEHDAQSEVDEWASLDDELDFDASAKLPDANADVGVHRWK